MDVWVAYRDSGCGGCDWNRDLVGVYATLDAAQADMAARHMQLMREAYAHYHLATEPPLETTTTLGPWGMVSVDTMDTPDSPYWPCEYGAPHERWRAAPCPSAPYPLPPDPVEFYAEHWTVQG